MKRATSLVASHEHRQSLAVSDTDDNTIESELHRAQEKIHLLHESLERGQRHMQSLAKMLTMVIKDNDKIRRPASQQQQQQRAAHAETQRLDAVATKAMWHNPAVARFLMPLSSPSSSPSGPRLGASSSAAGLLDSGRPDHASRSRSRTRSTQFTMVDTADLDLAPHSESQEWIDPNSSSAPASHSGAGSVAFTRPTSVQWPRDPHLSQQHFIADASTNHAAFQRQLSTSSYLRPPSAVERERTMHAMPWKSPSHQFEHSPKTDSYTFSSSPASAAARTPNGQSPTSALPASKRKVVERYLVARAPPADEPIPAFCFVPASRAVVTPDQSVSAANSSPHGGHAFAHPEYQHADSVHRQQYQLPSPQHRLHSASRSAPISPSAHPHPKSPPAGYSSSSPSSLAPLIGSPVVMCFDPSLPVPVVPPLIEPALFRHNRVIKTVNVPLASLSPSSLGGTRPVSSKLSSDRAPRIGSHAASPHRAMPFTPVATSVPISPPHRPSHAMGAQSSASSAALSFVEFPSTPTSKARAAGDQPLAPYSLPLIDDSSRVTLAPEVVVEAPHHSFAAPTDALSSALAVPSAELATLAAQIVTIPSALVDIEAVESSSPSELAAPVATTDGDTTLACESVVAAPASLGTHSADLSMTEPVDAFLSEQSTAETTNTSVSTTINASSASNSTSQSHVANTSAPADMASPLGSSHAAPSFDAPAALMAHLTMQLPPWHNTAAAEFGSPLAHRTSTGFSLASASAHPLEPNAGPRAITQLNPFVRSLPSPMLPPQVGIMQPPEPLGNVRVFSQRAIADKTQRRHHHAHDSLSSATLPIVSATDAHPSAGSRLPQHRNAPSFSAAPVSPRTLASLQVRAHTVSSRTAATAVVTNNGHPMAPLSPSFSHRPSSAVRAQSPQLRAADLSRAQHELQRQRVANAQAAAANAADAANAAAAHLSSLLSAAAPPAAAEEVEGAANFCVRVEAHGDVNATSPIESSTIDSAATLDVTSAPVDRGISVDIEFRPSSTTVNEDAFVRAPETPPHTRVDHTPLDRSALFHAATTSSRPLHSPNSAATLSLAPPPLYLGNEPLPPLVSGQHFYEAYAGAAAFKSPLVSKGTKVLSGGGGSGGERAHCLKRTTGRTPTASDYAYQWPHCTVPAPLLRQYQALNQHRWLELQAQRRRQEQEWADFQAQKAAAGLASSPGLVVHHQPALPSISTPVAAAGFAYPFPASAHSAANTSHYGTPVQPHSHSPIPEIDPLAPPSMQLVYEFDAAASLHVHQQQPAVPRVSAIPAAAYSASTVSPSHVAHHDRHRAASPQPALHRAASRRSLDSGAAFSFTEPVLDATTATLSLASAAAPLCAKPPLPVLNPDIVAPDSKVDRHRAPDPDKYRIEHQRHWI